MNLATTCPNMAVPCEYVRRMNMTPEERALADAYERDLLDKALIRGSAYTEGEARGRAEGRAEGRMSEREETARAMLAAGKPHAEILQFSRLTEEELDKLMN